MPLNVRNDASGMMRMGTGSGTGSETIAHMDFYQLTAILPF